MPLPNDTRYVCNHYTLCLRFIHVMFAIITRYVFAQRKSTFSTTCVRLNDTLQSYYSIPFCLHTFIRVPESVK